MTNKMTRAEFWARHEAIKQMQANGAAVPPSSPAYNRDAHMALHREYYGQWARHLKTMPEDLLKRCALGLAEGDEHMNSPYTGLKDWDAMAYRTKGVFAEDYGTWKGWSLSLNTCILKEAARRLLEAQGLGVGTIDIMGRRFAITAAFTNDDAANEYMMAHSGEGVIATVLGVILIANVKDAGVKLPKKQA